MTKKKPDPMLQVPPFIKRPHYACRLRADLADAMREQCKTLNCSQGVWLEVAITKALLGGSVTQSDVYSYCHDERWLHRVLEDVQNGIHFDDVLVRAAHAKIAKLLPGAHK